MAARSGAPAPRWYCDAVVYQLHVRAFRDSDGDGVGDFPGLIGELDYLRDLGVTALWLLPFYPSPLKDDGYDISDYSAVHPAYGTLRDVERFLGEAHRRGLRVITELVLNHTSDQHPWFQLARRAAPGSPERAFYVWSDTPDRYHGTRVIFQNSEASNWTWDPAAGAYYWHRFYDHQPDLNYDTPAVRRAVLEAVDFWFGMGVDGLRLDAVPYLYEAEGTASENLPETHAFLKELRWHVDDRFPDRMLLAEANQWPEEAVAYFGDGDQCHMAFHFPLMPRLFMALRAEDREPVLDILAQTPPIPDGCQWVLFLRNHDELTLEMVTDEERLFMYRAYARDAEARINLGIRRRLAPLLGNNRRQIELMNGLLFSLPGTPVVYYGDEIGMGDNIYLGDRDGVRTPMQWSADRNAGFSRAHPQRLYLPLIVDHEFHHETVHVEAQQSNPHSLLHFMRQLVAQRRRHPAFGSGTLELLHPVNHRVLAFVRRSEEECLLVVANLSRFVQAVELDLSAYRGLVPVELFGRVELWPVGDAPYNLTLGPHAFYWFALEPRSAARVAADATCQSEAVPVLATAGGWADLVLGEDKEDLEAVLPAYLRTCPWFAGKAQTVLAAAIVDAVAVSYGATRAFVALVRAEYADGDPETYVLPVVFVADQGEEPWDGPGQARIARVRQHAAGRVEEGMLVDAAWEPQFRAALLDALARPRRLRGLAGEVAGRRTPAWRRVAGTDALSLASTVVAGDQNNTTIVYGDRLVLKLFRRLEEGCNPEWEVGRFLAAAGFANVPPVAGALEYRPTGGEPALLGVAHGFVSNQRDAWQRTLDALGRYFERVSDAGTSAPAATASSAGALLALAEAGLAAEAEEAVGPYLDFVRQLGRRTAELHRALASEVVDPAFAPEPLSSLAQRALYQSMRTLTGRVFRTLRHETGGLPEPTRRDAERVLGLEDMVLVRFRAVLDRPISAAAIRCHGDYHLGQVLVTGDDVVVLDFEGEPARPLEERRLRRSPLRDVAGMLRSFHYAAEAALPDGEGGGMTARALDPWARAWQFWVSAAFLGEYVRATDGAPFLPAAREELAILLDAFLLEKAVYEVGYELGRRPDWVGIPLRGVLQLLADDAARP